MVGVQRGLLILMAAGAIALGPSAPKTSEVSSPSDDGTTAQASYQVNEKEYYLDAATAWGLQPGLQVTNATWSNVAGGQKPTIDYWVKDDLGRPLDKDGLVTPGTITVRFTVATWDGHYYKNLIGAIGNPSRDNSGTVQTIEMGHYKYTFAAALPTFDNTKPATLFMGARRLTTAILGKDYFVNQTQDVIPSTMAKVSNWNVTTTARCNACHDPLALHGGNYFEVKVCAICHNVNNFPNKQANGDWFNGQAWWHQIHSSNTTAVGAITFPQRDSPSPGLAGNSRNCAACHDSSLSGGGVWFTYPTRAACGACHAEINFVTGAGHSAQNIPQADDSACASCHPPVGTAEYDTSIQGAHVVPSDSTQLKGLTVTILSATNVGPGKKPTVTFKITEKAGNALAPNTTGLSCSLLLDGRTPTDYYMQPISESVIVNATYNASTGVSTYTFTNAIPATAKGTWTFSSQYRRTVVLQKAVGGTISYTEGGPNPIFDVSVDGSPVVARRTVVALAKCNACHDHLSNLFSHGGQRNSIQFCVVCHNPNGTDAARRPADGSANPPEGISFAHMIHRIHTGEELVTPFSVYGFSGAATPFNEVTYPGNRRDCIRCHVSVASFSPPIQAGALNVLTPRDPFSPQGPATAACLGCHDAEDFAAHAYINTAVFPSGTVAEACAACHGASSDLSPAKVHAQ